MTGNTQSVAKARDIVGRCFKDMRFARAAELARAKEYDEAVAALAPAGRLPTDPNKLDLLARIAAQRGRYLEAEKLWEDAGKLAPDNEAFKACAAQAVRARHLRSQAKQAAIAVGVAVVVGLLAVLAIEMMLRKEPRAPAAKAESSSANVSPR